MKRIVIPILLLLIMMKVQAQDMRQMVCQGSLARLDSLLNDTTNIDIQDKHGRSLLYLSVACNQEKVFDYLVDRGIDINMETKNGGTPLLLAVKRNKEIFVEKLLALGAEANFNKSNQNGITILMEAVLSDDLSQIIFLIEHGAQVNAVNKRGNTSLDIANREGLDEVSQYLISKGAETGGNPMAHLKGEYLGQQKPALIAKMFAPNFISTENFVHNGVFHPNGKEFYYTIETRKHHFGTIMVTKLKGNTWSKPKPAPIPGDYREVGPYISKDGLRLYYATNRPVTPSDTLRRNTDIWLLEREGESWGLPIHLGNEMNTAGNEWFPTFSDQGTIYFYVHETDGAGNIYSSKSKNGKYKEGVLIEGVGNSEYYNYDPYIAQDESYIIFASSGRPDGLGSADLYISFIDDQNKWSKPKNMGEGINSSESEFAPLLTPDGKYLFFARGYGDVFWVDAKIIEELK